MAHSPHSPYRIGLALGSGGARGWSHLGVLRRLNELGLPLHCIAGTSIGSIAAAVYASDSLDTMESLATQLDWKRVAQLFLEVGLPRSGLLAGKNIMRFLKDVIPARAISDLSLPFAAVATDLQSETEIVLNTGNLFDAIRASIAIPGILTPLRLNGKDLVDGGLVNPLPVSVCRAMGANFVIAVDINLGASTRKRKPLKKAPKLPVPSQRIAKLVASVSMLVPTLQTPMEDALKRWTAPQKKDAETLSIFDVLTRSFRLIENQITRRELALNPPDILIQPAVGNIMTLEFHRGQEAIAAGVSAVDEMLPQLRQLLTFKS